MSYFRSPGQRTFRPRYFPRVISAVSGIALVASLNLLVASSAAAAGNVYYVSTTGSDSSPGTAASPFSTLGKGLKSLRAGDRLVVRGGRYQERLTGLSLSPGTAANPIRVEAAPGERPVLEGLLWTTGAHYWTFDGLNVTWNSANKAGEHMVKFKDGEGWRFTNAEVWGARSFAAILVSGASSGWSLDHLYVHDTYRSNGTNQDHLIYVNTYKLGGTIERSVLSNSENGRAVKVGPSSGSTTPIGGVNIRYNTMFNNLGPSNVQLSYGATGNVVYRNIMQRSSLGASNVTGYSLNGKENRAFENVGWESTGVISASEGVAEGGGNLKIDPKFADPTSGDFGPLNPSVQAYGRYADETIPPTTTTTTAPTTTTTTAPTTTTTTAPQPTITGITLTGSASGVANGDTVSLTIPRPTSIQTGHVMVASVDVRGKISITPPNGWTFVRRDAIDTVSIKSTYVKVAQANEPVSYIFTLGKAKAAVGLLLGFSGVNTANPVIATSGLTGAASNQVTAPSLTTTAGNSMVVALFQIANINTIAPPSGLLEVVEDASASSESNVTAQASVFVQASSGATGNKVAQATSTAVGIGQLIALRPA